MIQNMTIIKTNLNLLLNKLIINKIYDNNIFFKYFFINNYNVI